MAVSYIATFSDSGAHVSQIMDASLQTHLLSHWVRDKQAFTLEEAVKMLTCDNATQFGFHDRGLLREGMAADIVVFDPEVIADRATYSSPVETSTGISYVMVNGTAVIGPFSVPRRDGRSSSKKSACQSKPAPASNADVLALGVQRGLSQPLIFWPVLADKAATQRPRSCASCSSV